MTTPVSRSEVQTTVLPQLESAKVTAQATTAKKVHVCSGHSEFFHRYMGERKAERKANRKVAEMNKDSNIKNADFTLIRKSDHEGARSGYFNGLNRIYKLAVMINFSHVDDSKECPFNPANEAA